MRTLPLLAFLWAATACHSTSLREDDLPTQELKATEVVVLVHGLGRSSRSMNKLGSVLEEHGYEVQGFDYPSTSESVEEHGEKLRNWLEGIQSRADVRAIHLVTHSMGGIVARAALAHGAAASAVPMAGGVNWDLSERRRGYEWSVEGYEIQDFHTSSARRGIPHRCSLAVWHALGLTAVVGVNSRASNKSLPLIGLGRLPLHTHHHRKLPAEP